MILGAPRAWFQQWNHTMDPETPLEVTACKHSSQMQVKAMSWKEQAICEQHPAIFYGQSSFKMDFDAVFLDVYFWLYYPINASIP